METDNNILNGCHACNCILPTINGGSTECCKGCANNLWKDKNILDEYKNYKWDRYRGKVEYELNETGKLVKIIYYN